MVHSGPVVKRVMHFLYRSFSWFLSYDMYFIILCYFCKLFEKASYALKVSTLRCNHVNMVLEIKYIY